MSAAAVANDAVANARIASAAPGGAAAEVAEAVASASNLVPVAAAGGITAALFSASLTAAGSAAAGLREFFAELPCKSTSGGAVLASIRSSTSSPRAEKVRIINPIDWTVAFPLLRGAFSHAHVP